MSDPLFDPQALALRRARALRKGPRLFLAERAIEDLADRLRFVDRRFGRALLVGCPDPRLAEPLADAAKQVVMVRELASVAEFPPQAFDLLIIIGQLDTSPELPAVLHILRALIDEDGLLLGAFAGNNSLPRLRAAMLAADQAAGGGVAARVHPHVEASAFAGLLQDAGFAAPVVDIDRVRLRYRSLDDLVADLRGMGATNVLSGRARKPVLRKGLEAARAEFLKNGEGAGTIETLEIIHFVAWARAGKHA